LSLRFRYKRLPVARSLVSLQGRAERPRPLITVTLIGPTGSVAKSALLDTGADDTIFPEDVATVIGIDLTAAPVARGAGAGMNVLPVKYAEVSLRLVGQQEQREWSAWVGFTPGKLRHPMLGFAGFLQFFTATFHGDQEEVELIVNTAYQGT
jgi:predicted aspartyl protease